MEGEDNKEDEFFDLEEFKNVSKKTKEAKPPKEAKNAGLNIVYFPTNKAEIKQRPNMEKNVIGKHPCRCILNGPSGSGKSNLLTNLMCRPEFYGSSKEQKVKNYFDMVFIFSPTSELDDLVKYLNVPPHRVFDTYTGDTLGNIIETQKEIIKRKSLKDSPKIAIIMDDIQSDKKFLNSPSFKTAFISSRQYNISVFLCSQSWTLTPRFSRIQCTNLFFFASSQSEHKLLVDEWCPPKLTKNEFQELVDYATGDDYSFLHINRNEPFKTRYRKNLDEVLKLTK